MGIIVMRFTAFIAAATAVSLTREPLLANAGHHVTASVFGDHNAVPAHPVDYFVPNFGVDHEVGSTQSTITDTEGKLGHNLVVCKAGAFGALGACPTPIAVPHTLKLGLDADIVTSQDNLSASEAELGHQWSV